MLKELPLRMHHHAYAVKDQEANRHFIEDILGIPLVATWCERTFRPEVGREVDYCHTFFEIADGGALAFFQYADDEAWEKNRAILQEVGGSWHMALKVTRASFDELQTALRDRRRSGPHDRSRLLPVDVPEDAGRAAAGVHRRRPRRRADRRHAPRRRAFRTGALAGRRPARQQRRPAALTQGCLDRTGSPRFRRLT